MADGFDAEWVELEKAMGGRPKPLDDLEERRKIFESLLVQMATQLPPTDPAIATRDEQISPDVKVRIYSPPNAAGRQLPCVVFLHGGGWLSGNLDTEDHECRVVCAGCDCVVVSAEYRVYPVKFPTPIDDCMTAYHWAYDNAASIGADAKKFIVWGGSAGGSLAVSVVHRLVASGQSARISGLVSMTGLLLHPSAVPEQYKSIYVSHVENGDAAPVVSSSDMKEAFAYLGAAPPYHDPSWFPLAGGAEALKGFPPTYIITCSKDAARDDGAVLEAELKENGVEVRRDNLEGWPHYFWVFPVQKGGAAFREKLVEGIKWVIREGKSTASL